MAPRRGIVVSTHETKYWFPNFVYLLGYRIYYYVYILVAHVGYLFKFLCGVASALVACLWKYHGFHAEQEGVFARPDRNLRIGGYYVYRTLGPSDRIAR